VLDNTLENRFLLVIVGRNIKVITGYVSSHAVLTREIFESDKILLFAETITRSTGIFLFWGDTMHYPDLSQEYE
jgi:hypothetical protein